MKYEKLFSLVFMLFGIGCSMTATNQGKKFFVKKKSLHFQVDPDSPLYEVSVRAANEWARVTGGNIKTSPNGNIPIFLVDKLINCPEPAPGQVARACSDIENEYIQIPESMQNDPALYGAILHEMGHFMRGYHAPKHIEIPNCVMSSPRNTDIIQPEDIEYVCVGFQCNLTI